MTTGVVVSLRYDGDDEVERFLIGSIEERRAGVAITSPNSPLGQALMGHQRGDHVSYDAPTGALMRTAIVSASAICAMRRALL